MYDRVNTVLQAYSFQMMSRRPLNPPLSQSSLRLAPSCGVQVFLAVLGGYAIESPEQVPSWKPGTSACTF